MIERRGDLDLAGKAVGTDEQSQLRPEHLYRHLAVMLQIVRQVDRRHSAPADLLLESVAARERG